MISKPFFMPLPSVASKTQVIQTTASVINLGQLYIVS